MFSHGEHMANGISEVSRRDFLRAGAIGTFGAALADPLRLSASTGSDDRAVILLMLVGGPSQLETWDPKPDAPSEIRGPFRSIATSVPGVRISEHLPLAAQRMDRLTLIRSLYHDASPIHETGHQLIQTGRLCPAGQEAPHLGSVVGRLLGPRNGLPPFVLTPKPIGHTGVAVPHGQSAGSLGEAYEPFLPGEAQAAPVADGVAARALASSLDLTRESVATRAAYGRSAFGQSCLTARRLVEAGVRVVTVNMYESVFNRVTWDCHGAGPFSTLSDYATNVLPTFDRAFSALIDDLEQRGLLDRTLVVATGEFGRTPRLNASGGRDHWPGVWSAALAGGGTPGGRIIGASDATASAPVDRPVSPAQLLATMYRSLGIDPTSTVPTATGESLALVDSANAISEVLA